MDKDGAPRPIGEPILEAEGLSFRYPGLTEYALRDVGLAIRRGEYVGITGASGAGKSTLCLALCGAIPQLAHGELGGRVAVVGKDTARTSVADLVRHVGIVFQDPESQLFSLSVFADVAFGMENLKLPRAEILERAEWALQTVGMLPFRDQPSASLSGGQKQRVAIACALAMGSEILILDEPTSELDPVGTDEVFSVLRELNRQGVTIVIAEQKVSELVGYLDRLVYLKQGRVVLDLPPPEFFLAMRQQYLDGGEVDMFVPQVTLLAYELYRDGIRDGAPPLTVEGFAAWYREVRGGVETRARREAGGGPR